MLRLSLAIAVPILAAADLEIDPVEPDFVVVNLPTTARLPKHKLAFRVTHRFARGLGAGDFGDLAADFFSIDGGAQTGLELRFDLVRATQLWIHRTSDRTIAFHVIQGLLQQDAAPVSLQADLSIEGLDNFNDDGRGRGQREGRVPRQLRAPRPGEANLRPGQPVPSQPEHQARVEGRRRDGGRSPSRTY